MELFKVSVIIPVYNAAKYVRCAVESAVHLIEVGEIILIEDKSPDNALEICKELENEYGKVRLLNHPNGENRGAGASRNLGILNAKYEFIAFLDADDWYLNNRFKEAKRIFTNDRTVDGVYESTGTYNDSNNEYMSDQQTTLKMEVDHKDLLYTLLLPHAGRFTTNAITVKKKALTKTGLFDITLRLHQDTHLWLRLAYEGKLVPGNIHSATAIRRVHSNNRISTSNKESRALLHCKTYKWFKNKPHVDKRAMRIILKRYLLSSVNGNLMKATVKGALEILTSPYLLLKII